MKKIIITGGLGYIGSELCKIYSGYSWNDKVIVIDNRFISERVHQLRKWNMEFIHGDILDKDLIKKYCHDADIVHHLAGVTSVPRVSSETNSEKKAPPRLRLMLGDNILRKRNTHTHTHTRKKNRLRLMPGDNILRKTTKNKN